MVNYLRTLGPEDTISEPADDCEMDITSDSLNLENLSTMFQEERARCHRAMRGAVLALLFAFLGAHGQSAWLALLLGFVIAYVEEVKDVEDV